MHREQPQRLLATEKSTQEAHRRIKCFTTLSKNGTHGLNATHYPGLPRPFGEYPDPPGKETLYSNGDDRAHNGNEEPTIVYTSQGFGLAETVDERLEGDTSDQSSLDDLEHENEVHCKLYDSSAAVIKCGRLNILTEALKEQRIIREIDMIDVFEG